MQLVSEMTVSCSNFGIYFGYIVKANDQHSHTYVYSIHCTTTYRYMYAIYNITIAMQCKLQCAPMYISVNVLVGIGETPPVQVVGDDHQ